MLERNPQIITDKLIKQITRLEQQKQQASISCCIFGIRLQKMTLNICLTLQQKLQNITWLIISDCHLRTFDGFPHLKNLKNLDVSFNQIRGSFQYLSRYHDTLQYVNVSHNQISQITRFEPMRRFKVIYIYTKFNPFCDSKSKAQFKKIISKLKTYKVRILQKPRRVKKTQQVKEQEKQQIKTRQIQQNQTKQEQVQIKEKKYSFQIVRSQPLLEEEKQQIQQHKEIGEQLSHEINNNQHFQAGSVHTLFRLRYSLRRLLRRNIYNRRQINQSLHYYSNIFPFQPRQMPIADIRHQNSAQNENTENQNHSQQVHRSRSQQDNQLLSYQNRQFSSSGEADQSDHGNQNSHKKTERDARNRGSPIYGSPENQESEQSQNQISLSSDDTPSYNQQSL